MTKPWTLLLPVILKKLIGSRFAAAFRLAVSKLCMPKYLGATSDNGITAELNSAMSKNTVFIILATPKRMGF